MRRFGHGFLRDLPSRVILDITEFVVNSLPVFTLGGSWEPLNPLTLTRAFQSFPKRPGLTGAKAHDLRHFHASVMLQNGQILLLVSKTLGHARIAITRDIYGHLLPGWQQ
ncbi:MAG: hypothetical protein CL755_00670 [Chloroflexi bacterium]|nr:hypothetical protein [Chloroflexota bacterium]